MAQFTELLLVSLEHKYVSFTSRILMNIVFMIVFSERNPLPPVYRKVRHLTAFDHILWIT